LRDAYLVGLFLAGCSSAEPAYASPGKTKLIKVKCLIKKFFTRHLIVNYYMQRFWGKAKDVCKIRIQGALFEKLKKTMRPF
jgi:hypothetical protein